MLVSLTIMIYQYLIKGKHKNDMDRNNEEEIHIYIHIMINTNTIWQQTVCTIISYSASGSVTAFLHSFSCKALYI